MSIHTDLEKITQLALHYAKEHGCNYNIILMNPNEKGEFSHKNGSTYEFVRDSYFDSPRPNVVKINTTDELQLKGH